VLKAATCDNIRQRAFASHPKCYVDSGFCTIVRDVKNILALMQVFKVKDLLTFEALEQISKTKDLCVKEYGKEFAYFLMFHLN